MFWALLLASVGALPASAPQDDTPQPAPPADDPPNLPLASPLPRLQDGPTAGSFEMDGYSPHQPWRRHPSKNKQGLGLGLNDVDHQERKRRNKAQKAARKQNRNR